MPRQKQKNDRLIAFAPSYTHAQAHLRILYIYIYTYVFAAAAAVARTLALEHSKEIIERHTMQLLLHAIQHQDQEHSIEAISIFWTMKRDVREKNERAIRRNIWNKH